jgi:prolyl oligopeptidase
VLLTPSRYRKPEPAWETVLDVDALGAAEGVSWVWAGSTVLDETLAPNPKL